MKFNRRKLLMASAGAAVLPALPHVAFAIDYPTRPVRLLGVRVASFEDEAPTPEQGAPVQLALPL